MRHSTVVAVIAGVITSGLLCGAASAGDVYKYTDERGNTMYTDRPMPGAVKVSSGAQRPAESSQRSYAAQQIATNQQLMASNQSIAQGQSDQRAAATVAKDMEASRAERCKKAREDYQNSLQSRRMYREEKDGTRTYLNESELSQQRIQYAKNVDAICGPQG